MAVMGSDGRSEAIIEAVQSPAALSGSTSDEVRMDNFLLRITEDR